MKRRASGFPILPILLLALFGIAAVRAQELAPGRFLLARAGLPDPNFSETVVLLIDTGEEGAFGLVVNRPTGLPVREVHPDLEGMASGSAAVLYYGGPVERGSLFALIQNGEAAGEARRVLPDVLLTTNLKDVAEAADDGRIYRLYAGYSGWAPGQLEAELRRGDWVIAEADSESLFSGNPEGLWDRLFSRSRARIALAKREANTKSAIGLLTPPPRHPIIAGSDEEVR